MYQLGALGQQGSTFTVRSQRGERPYCPSGSQEQSRHGQGLRESVTCYRAPVFAPPPTTTISYEAPRTTVAVPTAVSTQVSPQISPTLAQQQASPGAAVSAQPVAAPGAVTATPSTGITEQQLRDILSAQQAAVDAEREAEERKKQAELETLRREMSERERASQEIFLASQKAEADRVAAERFAAEQAAQTAIESQAAIPPPPSMTYAPSGGGGFPLPAQPPLPSPDMTMAPEARDVTITQNGEAETPWALILLAVAGVGVVAMMGKKGGKRKRGKR